MHALIKNIIFLFKRFFSALFDLIHSNLLIQANSGTATIEVMGRSFFWPIIAVDILIILTVRIARFYVLIVYRNFKVT
jgi:hypothetical protein